jgi:molybdate transport system substrate-binding protein
MRSESRGAYEVRRHPVRAIIPSACLSLLLLAVSACGTSTTTGSASPNPTATSVPPVTLNVFAASSLKAAFTKIGTQFHTAHPNVTTNFNFGGSDALAAEINQSAPADVFASANTTQMNVVVKAGGIDGSAVKTFAHNRLTVVLPKNNPANITTLQDLAKPGIKVVLAAKTVPAGQYALVFFQNASKDPSFGSSYQANVLKNVVSYEADVKSVLTKVSLGEADAGIVYTTDAETATSTTTTLDIPDALNVIALYPIGVVKASQNATVAQQFVDYVVGPDGQAVLAQYGFIAGSTGAQYAPPS